MTAPSAPSPGFLLRPRFDAFIEALCAHIAGEGAKRRIAGPLIILVWQRFRRLAARFDRFVTTPLRPLQKRNEEPVPLYKTTGTATAPT